MRSASFTAVLAAGIALVAACGISSTGELAADAIDASAQPPAPDTGPGPGPGPGPNPDASAPPDDGGAVDATTDVAPPGCIFDACAAAVPEAGFAPILMGAAADTCPSGFTATDMIEAPVAAADACACGTCVMTGTTCSTGNLPTKYDTGNGTCATPGGTLSTNGGNCSDDNGTFGENARIDPPTAVPGTCTAPATADRTKVTSTPRKVCTLDTGTCSDRMCTPPSPLRACMIADGDVACPGGAAEKHLVGADYSLTCGAACGCTTTATCGGSITFWGNNGCSTGQTRTLTAGACTNTGGASFSSYKWTGIVASETCTGLTPPSGTVALTQTKTICCP